MSENHLVTGPPRSGKTTTLELLVDRLPPSASVGGVVCPERRVAGERVGFELRALDTGETASLASVDREAGPSVGKYRVNVDAVDELGADAVLRGIDSDVVIIDEIAPMQCHGAVFLDAVRTALDATVPVVAAIATSGIGDMASISDRPAVTMHDLRAATAEAVAERLTDEIRGHR